MANLDLDSKHNYSTVLGGSSRNRKCELHMHRTKLIVLFLLVAVWLSAQATGPSQLSFSPLGASTSCVVSASTGSTLCAATDGFYISVAGGPLQKIATVQGQPAFTSFTCTSGGVTAGSTGGMSGGGCTFK